jgi:hypothetical protein
MSDVSMMIRKQEKKLTEVLVKKTHFSFGEIGRATIGSQLDQWEAESYLERSNRLQCYYFICSRVGEMFGTKQTFDAG